VSTDRFFPGQPLTADVLNRVVDAVLDRLRAGPGVYVTRIGREVVLSSQPVLSSGTLNGLVIDAVNELPSIPTTSPRIVWWLDSSQGGTGDNQLWAACPGQSEWTPLQNWTWLSGVPSS